MAGCGPPRFADYTVVSGAILALGEFSDMVSNALKNGWITLGPAQISEGRIYQTLYRLEERNASK